MIPETMLARIDARACLDLLARIVRHKSYTQTEGEWQLAEIGASRPLPRVTAKVPSGRIDDLRHRAPVQT
jgi:hypothetical protein